MDKRVDWIDVAKGVAILLVCVGHTQLAQIAALNSWITSFHMSFFFFVAGYCYNPDKYKSYSAYAVRKFKALGYPYFMLCLFVATLCYLLIPNHTASLSLKKYFLPYPGCYVLGFWFQRYCGNLQWIP